VIFSFGSTPPVRYRESTRPVNTSRPAIDKAVSRIPKALARAARFQLERPRRLSSIVHFEMVISI
jgi:hypothetical protein